MCDQAQCWSQCLSHGAARQQSGAMAHQGTTLSMSWANYPITAFLSPLESRTCCLSVTQAAGTVHLSSLGPLQPPSSQDTNSVSQWLPSSMEVAAAHFLARAALASDSSL